MMAPAPYEPYPWADNLAFVYAIKAAQKGEATAAQQQLIIKSIVEMSGYHDLSYRPSGDRDTCFAEGKRFVGGQIIKLVNLSADTIEKSKQRKKANNK